MIQYVMRKKDSMFKKILLTGSTGFIGTNLKEKWIDKYDIYCPERSELNL